MHTSSPSFRETKTGRFPSLKLTLSQQQKVSKVEYFKLPPVQKNGGVLCMNEVELPS